MKYNVIGIDLAKTIFQICALNDNNEVIFNKKVKRTHFLQTLRQFEATRVVMEACYSSNHWAREIMKLGHQVKLIPAFRVKPFVVGNKNDANDALAICEAARRPKMRFVQVKSLEQQDIQTLYRIRQRLIKQRTALVNQLRGLLSEYGVAVAKTKKALRHALPDCLEDADNALSPMARMAIARLSHQWQQLDEEIEWTETQLLALVKQHQDFELVTSIPGVGPMIAGAIFASIGDAKHFKNGRQLAAWLGLTPKQFASGQTNQLRGMSKRGNVELRKMLIHGARTVINWCQKKPNALTPWLTQLLDNKHPCKVIVALANKMARMIWAVLVTQKPFDASLVTR